MLSIILIAVSIGTISLTMPAANFTIPVEAFNEPTGTSGPSGITGATGSTGGVGTPGSETMKMGGWVIIEVYDKTGFQKYYSSNHNLIVDEGNQVVSDLLFGTTFTTGEAVGEMTFIQLGTGIVDPDEADTNCGTPAGSKYDATVVNHPTLIGAILNVTGNFGNQFLGAAISEICLTDSITNSSNNLMARQEFTPFTFNAGDTVNATWSITAIDHDGN